MKILESLSNTKYGFVSVADQVPEFKSLIIKDKDNVLSTFIFYMYDKESPYINLLERARANQIVKDFGYKKKGEEFLSNDLILAAGKKLQMLQMTPAERHLYRAKQKLEECVELYNETPVSHENFSIVAKEIERSQGLFSVIEKLEERFKKEDKSRLEGGGEKALFEDP